LKTLLGRLAAACVTAVVLAVAPSARADYPERPVRIVVPFAPGGVTDICARIVAGGLERTLGQPVVIDNRGGAGGLTGTQHVAQSAPDGYTLLFQATTLPGYPVFNRSPGVDVVKDLAPISLIVDGVFVMAATPNVPFDNFRDFVAYARANPGKLNYGTTGPGALMVYFEAIKQKLGLDIVQVSYRSAAAANQALLAGEVQLQFPGLGRLLAQVREGQAKPLAVSATARLPELPNVPTFRELGIDGIENYWLGLLAPAGTPRPVIDKLRAALVKIVAEPEVRSALEKQEFRPVVSTPEEYGARIAADVSSWTATARAAGIRPE